MKKRTEWVKKLKNHFESPEMFYWYIFGSITYLAYFVLLVSSLSFYYNLSIYGIKTEVKIVYFESYGSRGSKNYVTKRKNDNSLIKVSSYQILENGEEIYILIMPDNPSRGYLKGYLNGKSSNLFDVFMYSHGGFIGSLIFLTVNSFILIIPPILATQEYKNRNNK